MTILRRDSGSLLSFWDECVRLESENLFDGLNLLITCEASLLLWLHLILGRKVWWSEREIIQLQCSWPFDSYLKNDNMTLGGKMVINEKLHTDAQHHSHWATHFTNLKIEFEKGFLQSEQRRMFWTLLMWKQVTSESVFTISILIQTGSVPGQHLSLSLSVKSKLKTKNNLCSCV